MPFPEGGARASCAAATFTEDRIVLTYDDEQTVQGRGLRDGCADGGSCSAGCSGSCQVEDPESPQEDVELRIAQRGRTWSLGKVDADESYEATWTFELPAGVEPGRAGLMAGTIQPVVVTVR